MPEACCVLGSVLFMNYLRLQRQLGRQVFIVPIYRHGNCFFFISFFIFFLLSSFTYF